MLRVPLSAPKREVLPNITRALGTSIQFCAEYWHGGAADVEGACFLEARALEYAVAVA